MINVYAPNKDTNIINFLNNLLITLRKNNFDEEENIIIGGDFNCPPNPILDKKGGLLIPRKSVVTTIENLQEELDLVDIWRVKNPERKSFTWSQNSPMIFCRLDYWLISNSLHDLVKTTDIIKTDHAAISLELVKVTVDLQGCLPKNHSYARRLCFNHRKVYIIVKLIKCKIRKNKHFKDLI